MQPLLADESVERRIILFFRDLGFDIKSISETCPSVKDDFVLKIAFEEARILITNDKDFGYMVIKQKKSHKGVVLLRFSTEDVSKKISFLKKIMNEFDFKSFQKQFVVISEKGVRIARLMQ